MKRNIDLRGSVIRKDKDDISKAIASSKSQHETEVLPLGNCHQNQTVYLLVGANDYLIRREFNTLYRPACESMSTYLRSVSVLGTDFSTHGLSKSYVLVL